MIKKSTFFLGLSLLGLSSLGLMEAKAQNNVALDNDTTNSLLDMSLEDLINMKVTVASKKAEKISDAPGSITAYSDRDIERLGYYTLADLASITPGYSAIRGLNVQQFETRGQFTSGGFDNNKHVVLIDGIPVYNARANMAPSMEELPLLSAKRVEFLRGPGSALYGISAFNGVINIISKELETNGVKVDSKVSGGNYDMKKRIMLDVEARTDDGVIDITAGYYGKESTNQYLGSGQTKDDLSRYVDYSTAYYMNSSYKLLRGHLKGLSTGTIYMKRSSGLGDWWMDQQNQTYPFTESQFETFIPYVKYDRKLSEKLSINTFLKRNISSEKYIGSNGWQAGLFWSGAGISAFKYSVAETEFKGEASYAASKNLSLVGGVNFLSRYGTGAPESYIYYILKDQGALFNYSADFSSRTSTYNTYSVYGQAQYNVNFLKGLIVTAGARMDMGRVLAAADGKQTNKYDQLSPRIAIVQKVTDAFNVKLMYGKALRAPMIKEVGGNEEAKNILLRSGNADQVADAANVPVLKAETIDNYEAAVTYSKSIVSASVTVFNNTTSNALYRGQTPGVNGSKGQAIVQNIDGKITAKGFEIEAQVQPIKNFKIGGNFSSARAVMPDVVVGGGKISGGDAFNVPTNKWNAMATYYVYVPVKMSFTLVASTIQSYRVGGFTPWSGDGSSTPGKYDINSLYGGQTLIDLNMTGEVTPDLSIELQVRNLANTEYITPAFFASRQLNVPGAPRTFLATLAYKF